METELQKIKKVYGEEMMHLCRELFPNILAKENLLFTILENNLAPTHSFAKDIREHNLYIEFKNWIYSFINAETRELKNTGKSPFELMDEAGYTLYECNSEEEIQEFKKYYQPLEELCTFHGGRLYRCHVFFAVKKDVDKIKREDYKNPRREDNYGISVLSIQFSKGNINDVSIKCRYNHTIYSPDYTFNNNLERIIPGLTKSFEDHYGFVISVDRKHESRFLTERLKYVRGNNGKYYRFNVEVSGIYYCENNIIVEDGNVFDNYYKNKERYLLIDNYVIDFKEKNIISSNKTDTAFTDSFKIGEIKNINVIKDQDYKYILFNYVDGKQVIIGVNKRNEIVAYYNRYVTKIDDCFLSHNTALKILYLPNALSIGNSLLSSNEILEEINVESVKTIGSYALYRNRLLRSLNLPNVEYIENGFLNNNIVLDNIYVPNLKSVKGEFLDQNLNLERLDVPSLEETKGRFLANNEILKVINAPNLRRTGISFLPNNLGISSIDFPNLIEVMDNFMCSNTRISEVNMPNVEVIGNSCLRKNRSTKIVDFPKAKLLGANFMLENRIIECILVPKLTYLSTDQSFCVKRAIKDNNDIKYRNNAHNKTYIDNGKRYIKVN